MRRQELQRTPNSFAHVGESLEVRIAVVET